MSISSKSLTHFCEALASGEAVASWSNLQTLNPIGIVVISP